MRTRSGQVRLLEVAARAGVAPITVSRAIRSPGKVSPLTRQRIEQAIDEIGYVPNQIAGSLASNRTNLVVALIPTIANSLFADTVQGLTEVLHEHGLHLAIGNTGHAMREEEALIAAFLAKRPCGMLLHGTVHTPRALKLLESAGITVVETGSLAARPVDVAVSYSNISSAEAMTLHLLQRGYRRIAMVGWHERERTREGQSGYRAALEKSGVAFDPGLMLDLPHSFDGGKQAVAALMEMAPAADAAFFLGVNAAIGAALECERSGIRVPDRLALASSDDAEMTRLMVPPLTCISNPRREVGRPAAQVIVDRLAGRDPDSAVIDVGFRLIHRGST
jgi:LacI family transcriptional regulator, gluconate utilization system Gnt-I transcriptional repressor